MEDILKNKIEYIKGVGPAKAEIIQKELKDCEVTIVIYDGNQ